MKTIFVCITVFLISIQLNAQTYVGGVLAENSTWTKSNNPYIVTSNFLIPENIELHIEPGVEVFFEEYIGISIAGLLRAIGNISDTILFTGLNNGPWLGLAFQLSSVPYDSITGEGTILSYCRFTGDMSYP
ncbi:MAG: hypothetical protein K8S18_02695, partial [Desulfobacula sp.]|nr:hypothetical protein [Desulfobacula sp.]